MYGNSLLHRHDGRCMSCGSVGSEQKEKVRKPTHDRAVVCSRAIMTAPVLIECLAALAFDLGIGHEFVCLKTSCQNNHVCRHESICSDDSIWHDFNNWCICEAQFVVV